MTAADALKKVMHDRGWGPAHVSVETDLGVRTITRILSGDTRIKKSTLKLLAVCLPDFAKYYDGNVAA